ncbi:MAG TPA: hypothetical protein VFV80_12140 [Geminicoccaceae bacterium]|nr:hypothetical protein [Geminicoccaceae bacterium]
MTLGGETLGRLAVSVIVVVILAAQLVVGFVDTGKWGWPILAYPMYKTAHFEGERLNHDFASYVVLSDSNRVEIKRRDLGMDFWIYWYNVVQPIRHGRLDALAGLVEHYCQELDGQVIRLEVEDLGIAIGRDGPVEGLPRQVLFATEVSCP